MASTFHILVGSHTFNVYTLHFTPSSSTLTVHSTTKVGYHPTYLAQHPTSKDIVIATIEQEAGELAVLKVDHVSGGRTQVIQKVGSGGIYPCFVRILEKGIYVPNFFGPSLLSMSFSSAAPHLDSSTGSIVKFKSPPHLSDDALCPATSIHSPIDATSSPTHLLVTYSLYY